MRSIRTVYVVSCHAEGEVGDVIVGGVEPPPGETLWEQAQFLQRDQTLRQFMLHEPRGGVFRHVNLLVPPRHPEARFGFLIMEPCHTPPMSGSNSICVATVLLDTGMVPMTEPVTQFALEAPGGLVCVEAECRDGKAQSITITNVPSFVVTRDARLETSEWGSLRVDVAYGGDSFVLVDAADVGLPLRPEAAADLARCGVELTRLANEQLSFSHPLRPDWNHISFCQLAGPVTKDSGRLHQRNAVAIDPGKIDRSPTGTGVSARLALLHARGEIGVGDALVMESVLGSRFIGRLLRTESVGGHPAIVSSITGRAWITGTHHVLLDPDDPWPQGYRLSDTWPGG